MSLTRPAKQVREKCEAEFIAAVGHRLALEFRSMPHGIREVVKALSSTSGKRLRTRLVVASMGWPSAFGNEGVVVGSVLELIHVGSLLHDDVVDRASHGRGLPSAFAAHGAETAVLAGACCFAAAGRLASGMRREVIIAVATTLDSLADGELRDVERAFDTALDVDRYLEMAALKTGALFALSCRLGAAVYEDHPPDADRYDAFGRTFGTAFQVLDDCLDLSSDDIGKPVGLDVRLGLYGLPVLFALDAEASNPQRRELLETLSANEWDAGGHQRARDLVIDLGGIDQALEAADRLMRSALNDLRSIPQGQRAIDLAEFAESLYEECRSAVD